MATSMFIKHHEILLRVVGAWPTGPLLPVFYFGVGILIFFLIFQVCDIIEIYSDLELLMDNLVSTVGVFSGLCKIATFRWKRSELKGMIGTMSSDWQRESSTSEVMRKNCTWFQRVATFIIIMNNSMNFTYFLQTVISYMFDEIQDRKFLARVKFPIDARQSPLYEVIIVAQFITASIHFNAMALVEGFLITLRLFSKRSLLKLAFLPEEELSKSQHTYSVLHACSKIETVRKEVKIYSKCSQTNKENKMYTFLALRRLCQKHFEFLEFSKNIQGVFYLVAFFHIFFLTLLQVMSGFMFIDGLERGAEPVNLIHYALLTTSLLTTTGYYCICGEYLKYQSTTIFYELYSCYWYTFSTENKKAMLFVLANAQKPVTLTMGKFSELSLIYFTTIVKTSFSYLSLIRAIR